MQFIIDIQNYFNSSVGEIWGPYAFAGAVFLVSVLLLWLFRFVVILKLKKLADKTENDIDDIIVNAVMRIKWPFFVILSLYLALIFVQMPAWLDRSLDFIIMLVFVFYAVKVLQSFVEFATDKFAAKSNGEKGISVSGVKALGKIVEIVLWLIAIIFIISNLGYDVTSLVTGLGIGGIAVALALQSILGDIFSSFSLYFDQPFKVGDVIMVEGDTGEVVQIGLKSTRIRTLQGEELIIPNNVLTNTKVQNFHRMERRRILFEIGVVYDTPKTKLNKIPEMIKEIIESHKRAEVNRVFFKSFGDSALIFEVVYYINSREYKDFVEVGEAINLAIYDKFAKEKIDMAFPTQTVIVKK